MYTGLIHLHMTLVALSLILLMVRYGLMMVDSPLREVRFLRVFPHIVDSFLVLSGVYLIVITKFYPFTSAAPWLTQKLICFIAYIALGVVALKLGKNKFIRTVAFLGALGWVAMAAKMAMTKVPMLF